MWPQSSMTTAWLSVSSLCHSLDVVDGRSSWSCGPTRAGPGRSAGAAGTQPAVGDRPGELAGGSERPHQAGGRRGGDVGVVRHREHRLARRARRVVEQQARAACPAVSPSSWRPACRPATARSDRAARPWTPGPGRPRRARRRACRRRTARRRPVGAGRVSGRPPRR